MQIGRPPSPCSVKRLSLACASGMKSTPDGAVDLHRDGLDLLLEAHLVGVRELERRVRVRSGDDGAREVGGALAAVGRRRCWSRRATRAVLERDPADELDLLVGVRREAVDRDDARHAEPAHRARGGGRGSPRRARRLRDRPRPSSSVAPPCSFSALIVATSTTADGRMLPCRQTMSMNFSIPMSAPKPDSVMT